MLFGTFGVIWVHAGPFGFMQGDLGSCRAILGYSGPIWRYFRPIRDPCGPPKRPQRGLVWHIIIYYAPENCFRATWAIWGHAGPFVFMQGHFGLFCTNLAPF